VLSCEHTGNSKADWKEAAEPQARDDPQFERPAALIAGPQPVDLRWERAGRSGTASVHTAKL